MKSKKKKVPDQPWFTQEIKKAISLRRVYNRGKRNGKTEEEVQKYATLYYEQKSTVQKMVRDAIDKYGSNIQINELLKEGRIQGERIKQNTQIIQYDEDRAVNRKQLDLDRVDHMQR